MCSTFRVLTRCNFQRFRSQIRFEGTYKAAVLKEALKDLSIAEQKRASLKEDEIRIQVHYCSVNSGDLIYFNDKAKLPFIPGYEFSGEVIEIGKKVTKDQVLLGEKVAALSLDKFGALAEECVVDVDDVFRIPSNVQAKEAAVLTCGHAMALLAFSMLPNIDKDDPVVISAGPAGLGLAAVDVAANVYGAKVIGVVDSNERAELLRETGAFKTIQFDSKIEKHILAATNKKGPTIVYDAVGEHMLNDLGKCVTSGGHIFLAAPHIDETIPAPPPNCTLTILSLLELRQNNTESYRSIINETLELADQGVISPHISAKFDFNDINKAIQYIKENKCTGKVLIKILN